MREIGGDFLPWDVPGDQFVDASTAWCGLRSGEFDPTRMGLSALGIAGIWLVAGELMLDVAALNKEEMLPWEKWSLGRHCGPGQDPSPEWVVKLDEVAGLLCGSPDAALAQRVYQERAWLQVTPSILSFATGAPVELDVR